MSVLPFFFTSHQLTLGASRRFIGGLHKKSEMVHELFFTRPTYWLQVTRGKAHILMLNLTAKPSPMVSETGMSKHKVVCAGFNKVIKRLPDNGLSETPVLVVHITGEPRSPRRNTRHQLILNRRPSNETDHVSPLHGSPLPQCQGNHHLMCGHARTRFG